MQEAGEYATEKSNEKYEHAKRSVNDAEAAAEAKYEQAKVC